VGKTYRLRFETEMRGMTDGMSEVRTLFVAGANGTAEDAEEHLLSRGTTLIGKGSFCGICLKHPTVSRRHAEILFDGDSLAITDTYSLNGVIVNGDPIPPGAPRAVTEGDVIHIGKVLMKIVCSDDARPA